MDEELKSVLRSMNDRLEEVIKTLSRVEARQIAVRHEIHEQAAPVVGSFASTDTGQAEEERK